MERDIYDEDHEAFRDVVKEFIKRYATAEKMAQWEADGEIDRATMLAAGEQGLIGLSVPEEFGGAGMLQDYRFRTIVNEEVIGAGAGSLASAFGSSATGGAGPAALQLSLPTAPGGLARQRST